MLQSGPEIPEGCGTAGAARSWRRASDLPRLALAAEFLVLFVAGPVAYFRWITDPTVLFPALWAFCFYCLAVLLMDPTFDRRTLWRAGAMRKELARIVVTFAVLGAMLTVAVAIYDRVVAGPSILFSMVRERPTLWIVIMLFYPLVSVYPQEIIWRTFMFHRYARLFGSRGLMIVASAAVFGHAHIAFHNWLAVVLCTIGGVLFARTYGRSRSTLAAWIDHALYGCLVFSVGLGHFFYSGAVHL